jgi:hypothetical protein
MYHNDTMGLALDNYITGHYGEDSVDEEFCPLCGGLLVWADEIATGYNGALSDIGTGCYIQMCEECGEVVES